MNIQPVTGNSFVAPLRSSTNETPAADKQTRATTAETSPLQAEPPAAAQTPANAEELSKLVKTVNDFVKPFNSSLEFNIDQDSGQTIVKIMDTSTKEVIKQIPSEEMLALAKALDQLKGLLVTQKA